MAPSSASSALALRHSPDTGSSEPLAGLVISVVLAVLSASALSVFTTQRYMAVKTWKQLPFVQWLVFAIYADSFLFVLATAILQFGFGVGYSGQVCESAILLCLTCYVTTKIVQPPQLIYMFMVEKAYIIRSSNKKPRMKSKLYLFNSFGMIGAYCIVVVPNFVLRFARVENGECIIGMQRPAMIPLIVFDLLVNIYLTIIFLKPLSSLYSYKNFERAPGSRKLRTMAMRTFIGCICTLASSIVNLSVLVGLNGEPGWVCLMCCNSDILFSAVVINWITSRDSTTSTVTDDTGHFSRPRSQHTPAGGGGGSGPSPNHTRTSGDELSAIPPRAARQRLPDNDDDYDDDDKPTLKKDAPRSLRARLSPPLPSPLPSTPTLSCSTPTTSTPPNTTTKLSLAALAPSLGSPTTAPSRASPVSSNSGTFLPTDDDDASTYSAKRHGLDHHGMHEDLPPLLPPPPLPAPGLSLTTSNTSTTSNNGGRGSVSNQGGVTIPPEHRPMSEVRVEVDYGITTTLSSEGGGKGGGRLGNTVVVVGAGGSNGGGSGVGGGKRMKGRNVSWYADVAG
ncbi:hypothetical protein C8A05DRAFT_37571 [Staphylotrichum tortipilum]|uniref:Uncharacterized protein n=1 Tax=Staphylotrichum tortipilum TaxID=2831512 RepID=A0AAN6RQ31_9PEZI|nr:hypothetical protein C8A05DRAFT_37571 [Staphylotrichum longicolle]